MEAARPFLERLDAEARKLLVAVARPVSFVKGSCVVRQGELARGAYVMRDGRAEAAVSLPGGEKLLVAKLGPGNVVGEMALIERGTCTATVTATADVEGWFLEREDFRALVAQREPAALRVQHALTLMLSDKLRSLNAKVLQVPAPEDRPASRRGNGPDPLAGVKRVKQASFDFGAFLRLLPVFEGFDEPEIAEVLAASRLLELPRGHGVFGAGQPSDACFVVLRGAVEVSAVHAKRETERRMAVLGPGQIFGFMSLLHSGKHGSAARVREQALLLEIPRKGFEGLYYGTSPASSCLRRAIQRSLLDSLGQTNRHLSRLISLARLRGARKEGDKLETAYGGQIVAAPEPGQA
jgi:CRP/FNR family transcriptional regulator, cyclic AMP receptor protein